MDHRLWTVFAIVIAVSSSVLAQDAVATGRDLYMQNCANCHGRELQGGNAKSMVDGGWQFGSSRAQIAKVIRDGLPDLGMPGYGKTMNDQQIDAMVTYIRDQERGAGIKRPKFPEELKTSDYTIDVELFAQDLRTPWCIAWIDRDHALVTERPGTLRVIEKGKLLDKPVENIPKAREFGQGGLMEVAVDPDHANNGWIYLAYTHALEQSADRMMTRVVRGKIVENKWTDEQVLWQAKPEHYISRSGVHFGCKIIFDKQGHLFFTHGERGRQDMAQDVTRPNGKVHRINTDGSIPKDNPFVDQPNAVHSIWTYGNRNPQGLAIHPVTGEIYETEHGPRGGDELNYIKKGVNYGWPVITYGINYNGTKITDITEKEGMEQPLKQWTPSIAASGLDFVRGDLFKKWENRLLVGALAFEEMRLVAVDGEKVLSDDIILKGAGRVRDVRCGPDGAIYVVLNSPDIILRLTPRR